MWSRERVLTIIGALALVTTLPTVALARSTPSVTAPVGHARPSSRPSGPVGPADDQQRRLAAYDEALVVVTQELSYLVLLDWIDAPVPAEAASLPAAIGIEPTDAASMAAAVRDLDGRRGPEALAQMRALDLPIPTPVDQVLSTNLPALRGDRLSVGAGVYLQARDQLLGPWGDLRRALGIDEPDAPIASTVPIVDAAGTSDSGTADSGTADSGTSDSGNDDGSPIAILVGALAGLLVLATALVSVRLVRRAGARSTAANGDDVLDAGRSIMAAADLDGFGVLTSAQVRRLVGADGAVTIDGRSWCSAARPLPERDVYDRVLATGRPICNDGVTLVPVVADGRVVAALVAWSDEPRAAEVLGAFAPLVGAALLGLRTRVEHEHLAFDDALTGVGNRRRFDRDLDRLVGVESGRGFPVALAMVDVDHFKRFNDTYGHQAGDAALRHVAAVVAANVRTGDLVYRYGGEEFAVLLPGAEVDEARAVVERVRAAVSAAPLGEGGRPLPPVTVSVGVSATPPVDASAMVRAADGALYAAKSNGRNRVEVHASA